MLLLLAEPEKGGGVSSACHVTKKSTQEDAAAGAHSIPAPIFMRGRPIVAGRWGVAGSVCFFGHAFWAREGGNLKCGLRSCTRRHSSFSHASAYSSFSFFSSTQKLCPHVSRGRGSPFSISERRGRRRAIQKILLQSVWPCVAKDSVRSPSHAPGTPNGFPTSSLPSPCPFHPPPRPFSSPFSLLPPSAEERALINESCPQRGNLLPLPPLPWKGRRGLTLLLPRFFFFSFAICKQQHPLLLSFFPFSSSFLCRVTRG